MSFTHDFYGVTVTLPTPRSDVRSWGGILNTALQTIMSAAVTAQGTAQTIIKRLYITVGVAENSSPALTLTHAGTGPPLVIAGKSAAPTTGLAAGALYYDTDDNKLYLYNGSAWKQITSAA